MPSLRVELVDDGRYDFMKTYKFNNAIQNADITFSMYDQNNRLRISKAPAFITLSGDRCCSERYIIEYNWKSRDTKEKGQFIGKFEINFKKDLYEKLDKNCNYKSDICDLSSHEDDEIYPEWFDITGEDNKTHITMLNEHIDYNEGKLIVPIFEDLNIFIR